MDDLDVQTGGSERGKRRWAFPAVFPDWGELGWAIKWSIFAMVTAAVLGRIVPAEAVNAGWARLAVALWVGWPWILLVCSKFLGTPPGRGLQHILATAIILILCIGIVLVLDKNKQWLGPGASIAIILAVGVLLAVSFITLLWMLVQFGFRSFGREFGDIPFFQRQFVALGDRLVSPKLLLALSSIVVIGALGVSVWLSFIPSHEPLVLEAPGALVRKAQQLVPVEPVGRNKDGSPKSHDWLQND